jgi:bacillithiol biosynthesis cysteine-adding enzyme BshC
MNIRSLPAAALPHTAKLFAAFVGDFARVERFYGHPPTLAGALGAAREARLPDAARRTLAAVLREQHQRLGGGEAVERSIERLARGAAVVVTGQQAGLFGGPAYTFYKALTAVALAGRMTAAGIDTVPIFWLASEDHDLAEVDHCWLPGRDGLERIRIAHREEEAGRRVGRIAFGHDVATAVARAAELLEGPAADEIATVLNDAYRPGETYASAFGRLLGRLVGRFGVIPLDPQDARLAELAAPVYARAIREQASLAQELVARSRQLERGGFHAQVKVTESATLLFLDVEGRRLPVRARNGTFVVGGTTLGESELLTRLEASPADFSGNVLLRPIVQDTLLPTAAIVAGPAEVAYFAQAERVYRRLLGRMPAIVPRAGYTLVPREAARLLGRYRVTLEDLFRGRQRLRARLERQFLSKALGKSFDTGEKQLRALLGKLRRPLGKLDKTLVGALGTAESKMLYQFTKLRGKAARAENFRTGVLDRHERLLVEWLYPNKGLQERTLSLLPFLAREGTELLDHLAGVASDDAWSHHVVEL